MSHTCMERAFRPCNVVSRMVEVSESVGGASGHPGGKIPCQPPQKQAKQGGDEDPREGVTRRTVSKLLARVHKPAVFWVAEFGKPVCYCFGEANQFSEPISLHHCWRWRRMGNGSGKRPLHRTAGRSKNWRTSLEKATFEYFDHTGDTVRTLQQDLSPDAEYILDWFHVTMKLTVLEQYAKGVGHQEQELGERLRDQVARLKWSLWHGHLDKALGKIEDIVSLIAPLEETCSKVKPLRKAMEAFRTYIENNSSCLPNYGERYRCGEAIATG